jgi:dTDP-4-amino-4,6-dideoxygalactose transaminase
MRTLIFNDLKLAAHTHKKALIAAFTRVVERGIFLRGPENVTLTKRLSKKFGGPITLTASGHDAIELSLQTLRLKPTDEVIVPANAYPTGFAVALSGAKLVLADTDTNGQLTVETIQARLTKHTKVVVLVHLYGLTGNIAAIKRFCTKHNILLIEDCAQSFGTTFKGKLTGTLGTFGCFSFYPTKNLGGLGDGGAVWSKTKAYANEIAKRTLYGEEQRYHGTTVSGHSNLPELQAAALSVYLTALTKTQAKRKQVARWYAKALTPLAPQVTLLTSHPNAVPAHHLLVVRVQHREKVQAYLNKQGIPTLIHYPIPLYRVAAFLHLGYRPKQFPITETLSREILSLPFHPYMSQKDVQLVVRSIQRFYEAHH